MQHMKRWCAKNMVRAAREKRREEKKAERAAAMAALEQQEEEIRKQRARLMGLEERSAAKHENFLLRSDGASQKLRQQLDKAQNAEMPQGPASMGHPMPAQAAPTYDTGAVVPGSLAMPTGAPQHGHVEMQPPAYKTAGLAIPTAAPKHVEMQPPPNRSGLAMPTGAQEHVEMQPPPSRAGLAHAHRSPRIWLCGNATSSRLRGCRSGQSNRRSRTRSCATPRKYLLHCSWKSRHASKSLRTRLCAATSARRT